MKKHILAQIFLSVVFCSSGVLAEEIRVHFSGQTKKPGVYKVTTPARIEDLEKACGGWGDFGSAKRLTIIRLERPSNATTGDPGERETQVYKFADIPRNGEKLVLKRGDIVFIPEKQVIGR